MFLQVGAAVVDGRIPNADGEAKTPLETIKTSAGVIVLEQATQTKGSAQNISVSVCQPVSLPILQGYAKNRNIVAISFIDKATNVLKHICDARITAVHLSPVDSAAWAVGDLNTNTDGEPKSVHAGTVQFIIV